jgi:FADH2 O2-dependent halogenase
MESDRAQVVVVGSGFAGALLARLLATQGLAVMLIERGRHPRFAIGESTTPLANLCLERLADRHGQPDLRHLAAHGRWLEHLPGLRRGLKRGFTFYRHAAGKPYANDAANGARLLVAASPNDRVADTHWLRQDVDHHFVRQAEAAGVVYRDRTRVTAISFSGRGVRLRTERDGDAREVRAEMLVDATGPGGLLRRAVPIPSALARTATRSLLLYSHFTDVRLFADVARESGASLPAGPYPEDWAAMHHLMDEGWMYVLRFDDGLVSAGLLATPRGARRFALAAEGDAARGWQGLLARYPALDAQFQKARPAYPVRFAGRVQHRLARATGDRWVVLPHTFAFVDPLFSTGIAWSLLAVERLTEAFGNARARGRGLPSAAAFRRYEALLAAEADLFDRLVAGAYLALSVFALFAAHAMLYFAVVSFSETRQRLVPGSGGEPFLGASEPDVERAYRESLWRLARLTGRGRRPASPAERREFAGWVARTIASRNVAGLADPERHNLYAVDLEVLVERGHLLGLTPSEVRRALPRLRGVSLG